MFYTITSRHVFSNHGAGLLRHFYGNSIEALVRLLYPQFVWMEWLFTRNKKWGDKEVHHLFFKWFGEELGFRELKDWNKLSISHFKMFNANSLLNNYYNGNVKKFIKTHIDTVAVEGRNEVQFVLQNLVEKLFEGKETSLWEIKHLSA